MSANGLVRRRVAAWGLLAVAAAMIALQSRPALAYSGTEHIRHSDQAYQILNLMRRGAAYAVQAQRLDPAGAAAGKYRPLTECPESVCPARTCPNGACAAGQQWSRFVAQALASPAKLDQVKSDLADPPASASCGTRLPKLGPGQLAQCRIGELPFAAQSGWGSNANECFLRSGYIVGGADQNPAGDDQHRSGPVLPFFQDLQSNLSGAALGMWSTGPDQAKDDTHLWVRPSNLVFVSTVRGKAQEIAEAGLTAGAIVLAPVVCLAEWIFQRDCRADLRSVTHAVSSAGDGAVAYWEQGVFGRFTDIDLPAPLPGLWHFGQVGREGQFNKVAGMKFIDGGADGELDTLDLAIIALSEMSGATLQSDTSQGVKRYARFADGDLRTVADWLGPTVGHVEFEPVQNLAQWGWTELRAGRLNAKGLGWVLHAIGDAGQPHHTISAIGWGHAEWERFANLTWAENFQEEDVVTHYPHLREIVAIAFRWWKFLDDRQAVAAANDLAVRELIVALLTETARLPVSTVGRAYLRGISRLRETLPDQTIRTKYAGEEAAMKDLMQRTIGASMAFLVKASDFVSAKGASPASPCDCGKGAARFAQDDAGKIVAAQDGLCHACGTGAFAAMPSWVDGACVAACPADKPTAQDGVCVATGRCPAAAPFVDHGVCVAACPPSKVVVDHRTCADACPAPQRPDDAGFCARLPTPPARLCLTISDDGVKACCSPVGAAVQSGKQCCSLDRRPDGFCRGDAGDQCAVDDDCISLSCVAHRCVLGANGGRCVRNAHCASGICVEQGLCVGRAGDRCSSSQHCDSGRCLMIPGKSLGTCDVVDGE
jgi:hypothetical protein